MHALLVLLRLASLSTITILTTTKIAETKFGSRSRQVRRFRSVLKDDPCLFRLERDTSPSTPTRSHATRVSMLLETSCQSEKIIVT